MTISLFKFPPPPNDIAPFDALPNGIFSNPWQRWFLKLAQAFKSAIAPADAAYVVTEANPSLTNETNLGALTDGYLHITTLAGVASVASVPIVNTTAIGITIDGSGSEITTGIKGYRQIEKSGTIVSWTILAFETGDIEFNVFGDPFTSFPPSTSIVGANPPNLVSADSGTDDILSGWSPVVLAGDVIGFSVVSNTGIKKVTLQLDIQEAL